MSAGYGFAEGFAKGMEKNFREWAADEKDAAAVAAARYEENSTSRSNHRTIIFKRSS
jgi:hypothetical protein